MKLSLFWSIFCESNNLLCIDFYYLSLPYFSKKNLRMFLRFFLNDERTFFMFYFDCMRSDVYFFYYTCSRYINMVVRTYSHFDFSNVIFGGAIFFYFSPIMFLFVEYS